MIEVHPASLAKLVRAVAVLALPYEGQLAWLRSLGLGEPGIADELAMELEDAALLSAQFEEAGWLDPNARNLILELRELLNLDSDRGNVDFWALDSLRTSPEWNTARKAALAVLLAL